MAGVRIGIMRITSVATSMVLATMPIFCQSQISEEQKALDSFKSLVSHHADSYKLNGREHVTKLGGGWAKERFILDPGSAKFDVEKTPSLVSPLVGTLAFTLIRKFSVFHSTEIDAAADIVFIREDVWVHKHVFAYQDHQWQPTSRQHMKTGTGTSIDGEYFACDDFPLKEGRPSKKDIKDDLFGCLEEIDGDK